MFNGKLRLFIGSWLLFSALTPTLQNPINMMIIGFITALFCFNSNRLRQALVTGVLGMWLILCSLSYFVISSTNHFVIPANFIGFFSMFILFSGPVLVKFFGGAEAYKIAGFFAAGIYLFRPIQALFNAFFISIFPYLSRAEALEDRRTLNKYIKYSSLLISTILLWDCQNAMTQLLVNVATV